MGSETCKTNIGRLRNLIVEVSITLWEIPLAYDAGLN